MIETFTPEHVGDTPDVPTAPQLQTLVDRRPPRPPTALPVITANDGFDNFDPRNSLLMTLAPHASNSEPLPQELTDKFHLDLSELLPPPDAEAN